MITYCVFSPAGDGPELPIPAGSVDCVLDYLAANGYCVLGRVPDGIWNEPGGRVRRTIVTIEKVTDDERGVRAGTQWQLRFSEPVEVTP